MPYIEPSFSLSELPNFRFILKNNGSGSFSSEHVHHHTDADDAPNHVYSSIPESQVAHYQYKDNQLQHQVRGVAGG